MTFRTPTSETTILSKTPLLSPPSRPRRNVARYVRFLLTPSPEPSGENKMPPFTRSKTSGVPRVVYDPKQSAPDELRFPSACHWTSKHLDLLGVKPPLETIDDLAKHFDWKESEWSDGLSERTHSLLLF
jgi:hypothetical protein